MIFGNLNGSEKVSRAKEVCRDMHDKLTGSGYFRRLVDNRNMFTGLNGGQYLGDSYKKLISMGVPPVQINYVMKEVRQKIGQIKENPFSISFSCRNSEYTDKVNLVQNIYDYNYSRGNWEKELFEISKDGMILAGYGKFYLDFKDDKEIGDFGFKRISPRLFYPDPDWISNDFKDCRKGIEEKWMDPYEITNTYKVSSTELELAKRLYDGRGNYMNQSGLYEELEKGISQDVDYQSGKFRIYELHYMETIKKREVVERESGRRLPVDEFTEEELSNIAQTGEKYFIDEESFEANKVFTFCPFFDDLVLMDDLYPIQCGSLPYAFFSYSLLDGKAQGLVDALAGIQMNINKRESAITHTLSTQSNNNYTYESDAFSNETEKRKFKRDLSRGGQAFEVTSGSNNENKIKLMQRGTMPTDLMNAVDRTVGQMKDIANSTNAVQGKGEGRESAILFRNKVEQALTPDAETILIWETLHKHIAEAFYANLGTIYGSAYRKLTMPNGKYLELNKYAKGDDGEFKIENDISKIPRYVFTINKSKLGTAKRQEDIAMNMELKKGSQNPVMQSWYEMNIIDNLDADEGYKETSRAYINTFINFQLAQMESQTAQLTLAKLQAEMQIKQLMDQVNNPQPNPAEVFQGGQGGQPIPDATDVAKGQGQGEIPSGAGVAGKQTASNNFGNAPSDMGRR